MIWKKESVLINKRYLSIMLSPVLIPMLEAMADLTLNDTTQVLAAV